MVWASFSCVDTYCDARMNGDSVLLVEAQRRRAAAFIRRYADTFGSVQTEPRSDAKRVLVIGGGVSGRIEVELCSRKGTRGRPVGGRCLSCSTGQIPKRELPPITAYLVRRRFTIGMTILNPPCSVTRPRRWLTALAR